MADLTDPISVERQTMQDIADAIRTRTAQGGGGETVPTGQIITMMGKTAPVGYLACDGTVYNIADYLALATYFAAQFEAANYFGGDGETTFAVPDLRGEFLRGTGTNNHANQGSGAAVGVHQDATVVPWVQSPANSTGIWVRKSTETNGGAVSDYDYGYNMSRNAVVASASYKTDVASVTAPERYTARPTNTSVLYCIKT